MCSFQFHSEWEGVIHTFVDFDTKEMLKEVLGFSQVPFIVIADQVKQEFLKWNIFILNYL